MAKLFGSAVVNINGKDYDTMPGATLDLGGVVRTTKNASRKVAGYVEKVNNSQVSCAFPFKTGLKVSDFDAADISILFKTDVGESFTIPKAWRTNSPTLSDSDGDLKLTFEGEPAEQH